MNFMTSHINGTTDNLTAVTEGFTLPVPPEKRKALSPYLNKEVILGIRPDDLSEAMSMEEKGTMKAAVEVVQPVGSQIYLDVKVGDNALLASVNAQTRVKSRQEIILKARLENLHFFDPVSEKAIR